MAVKMRIERKALMARNGPKMIVRNAAIEAQVSRPGGTEETFDGTD